MRRILERRGVVRARCGIPEFQAHEVGVPVEVSMKLTGEPAMGPVGLTRKLATGGLPAEDHDRAAHHGQMDAAVVGEGPGLRERAGEAVPLRVLPRVPAPVGHATAVVAVRRAHTRRGRVRPGNPVPLDRVPDVDGRSAVSAGLVDEVRSVLPDVDDGRRGGRSAGGEHERRRREKSGARRGGGPSFRRAHGGSE